MKIGVGARPVGMGGAFTAVADDANALFWNPAGLTMTDQFSGNLTFMKMLDAVSYTSGGITVPVANRFGFGAAAGFLSSTDTRRSETGEELGTFGVNDLVAGPGFAWRPVKDLGLGIAAKYVQSQVDTFRAYAISFDGGVMYRPFRFLNLGASLLHLGTPRRFIHDWEYPPTNLRAGTAFRLPFGQNYVLVASDLSLYPEYATSVSVGAEGYIRTDRTQGSAGSTGSQGLFLRAGYSTGSHLGIWSGWSIGIGYEYSIARELYFGVDAVYLSYGLLGGSERASAYLRFNPGGSGVP